MKKTLFLLLCVLAMCLCTFAAMADTCDSHTYNGDYGYDADYHWEVCATCGEAWYYSFEHVQDCSTGACVDCGATGVNFVDVTHTVEDWEAYEHDDTTCWLVCSACGDKVSEDTHYCYCSDGVCGRCGQAEVTFSTRYHTWDYDNYAYDEDQCWQVCKYCGEADANSRDVHYIDCGYDTDACRTCGQTGVNFAYRYHDWDYNNYAYDADYHWLVCKYCGEANTSQSSHYIYCSDGTDACYYCGATEVNATRSHTWDYDNYAYDADYHWLVCKYCGEANTSQSSHYIYCSDGTDACRTCGAAATEVNATRSHTWDYEHYGHDETYHWQVCAYCGEARGYTNYHYMDCATGACETCGATDVSFYSVRHEYEDYYVREHDDTTCWCPCTKCGEKLNVKEHYINCSKSTDACYYCGATDVTIGSYNHHWDYNNYAYDADYHWTVCKYCGEANTYKDTHYIYCYEGTDACSTCGVAATEINATRNHSWDYDNYAHDDDYHWLVCEYCGGANESKDEHYIYCYYDTDACYVCDAEDVNFDSYSHTWDYDSYGYDDDYHWYVCEYCGGAHYNQYRHSIDCVTGFCATCGAEEFNKEGLGTNHNHIDWETYYSDNEYHWLLCECGEIINKSGHYVYCSDGTDACKECGATGVEADYYHDWDYQNYGYDADYHWTICSTCGAANEYTSRHYMDCATDACQTCGATDVNFYSVNHTYDDYYDREHDETTCWHVCNKCGEAFNVNEHRIDCTTKKCLYCGATDVTGEIYHNYKVEVGYDEDKHWEVCLGCNEICWEAEHYIYCSSGACGYCGATDVNGERYHSWDYENYAYDEDYHWYVCKYCGEAREYKYDHYQDCATGLCISCGAADVNFEDVSHSHEGYYNREWDETTCWCPCTKCGEKLYVEEHWIECSTGECYYCGQSDVTAGGYSHNWDDIYEYDEDYHWEICASCGTAEEGKSKHRIDCGTGECRYCGATGVNGNLYHTTDWDNYEYDDNYCWVSCMYCDKMMERFQHMVDCDNTDMPCINCGATGVNTTVVHRYDDSNMEYDDDHHWMTCEGCGAIYKEEHYIDCSTGECYECGASGVNGERDHYTSSDSREYDEYFHWYYCRYCGEMANRSRHWADCDDPTNCNGCDATDVICEIDHEYDWSNYEYDASNHWVTCEDCGKVSKSEHYLDCVDGHCYECGATGVNGELSHDVYEMQYNEMSHWYICDDCGEDVYKSSHWLSCVDGSCRECGAVGVKGDVEHLYDWDAWEYDEYTCWMVCGDCGETFNHDEHWLDCQTGICTRCEQIGVYGETEHNYSYRDYKYDDNYHWYVCNNCGEEVYKNEHYLSCVTGACRACGQEDVEGNINHRYDYYDWQYDFNEHWHLCADCGEVVSRRAHTLSCTTGACLDCGAEGVTGTSGHNWDYSKYEYDSTGHWRVCIDCGATSNREVHYLDCVTDVCRYCYQSNVMGSVEHDYDSSDWQYNTEKCWVDCKDCGERVRDAAHRISCKTGACNYCGQVDVTGNTAHYYDDSTIRYSKDGHWIECLYCDYVSDPEEHYTHCAAADGEGCYFCKQTDVTINVVYHLYVNEGYESDAEEHWQNCYYCGEECYREEHDFDDGKCYCGMSKTLYISAQPASVTVAEGKTASVTVKAVGEGLTYQWYYRNAGEAKFVKSSTTTATYSTKMNETRDGRQVYCVITDSNGNQVISATATLNMVKPTELKILKQPISIRVDEGETATVTVEAQGDGLTYTWYYRNAGVTKFTKSSTTTNTYSMKMDATRDGRQVYCVITDQYGNSVTTNTVSMGIDRTDLMIIKQPVSASVREGETATVSVTAQGDGLTYTWYYRNAGVTKFTKSSTTTNTYSMEMNATRDGRELYCVITDQYGNTVTTNTVTISIFRTELKILKQPVSASVREGETATVTVEAQGDSMTYAWYYKNAGGSKFILSSTTTATYATEMTAARDGRELYCVITDEYGNSVTTNTVTISIFRTELKILKQPVSASVREGETATVTVEVQGDGLTYAWYYKNAGGSKFILSSTTTATYATEMTAARDGRELYCVITDEYGNTVTTNTVTISIFRTPLKIVKQPVDVTVDEGETATVTFTAQGDGLTYEWYYKNAGASKFVKSTTTTNTYSVTMNESRDGRQVYCNVYDQYGSCTTTFTVTLSMTPKTELKILKQPVSASVREGETVTVTVEAQGDGMTYTWYYRNAGVTKFTKSSTTTNSYSMEMNTTRDGREVYCVITDEYGNTVTSNTVTISIFRTELKITKQPVSVTVEEGEYATVTVTAQGDGLTYVWYYRNAGKTSFVKSSTTTNTYSMEMNATRDGREVYCVITDEYGNTVTSNTVSINMKKATELKITKQPVSVTVEEGEYATVTVTAQGDGLTYVWYYRNAGVTKFTKSSTTTNSYSMEMNTTRDGREVYCVITDEYGNTVTSNTVSINMK